MTTLIPHMTTLFELVHWLQHALYQHGVSNVNVDVDSTHHRAWLETRHWIVTIHRRAG